MAATRASAVSVSSSPPSTWASRICGFESDAVVPAGERSELGKRLLWARATGRGPRREELCLSVVRRERDRAVGEAHGLAALVRELRRELETLDRRRGVGGPRGELPSATLGRIVRARVGEVPRERLEGFGPRRGPPRRRLERGEIRDRRARQVNRRRLRGDVVVRGGVGHETREGGAVRGADSEEEAPRRVRRAGLHEHAVPAGPRGDERHVPVGVGLAVDVVGHDEIAVPEDLRGAAVSEPQRERSRRIRLDERLGVRAHVRVGTKHRVEADVAEVAHLRWERAPRDVALLAAVARAVVPRARALRFRGILRVETVLALVVERSDDAKVDDVAEVADEVGRRIEVPRSKARAREERARVRSTRR